MKCTNIFVPYAAADSALMNTEQQQPVDKVHSHLVKNSQALAFEGGDQNRVKSIFLQMNANVAASLRDLLMLQINTQLQELIDLLVFKSRIISLYSSAPPR